MHMSLLLITHEKPDRAEIDRIMGYWPINNNDWFDYYEVGGWEPEVFGKNPTRQVKHLKKGQLIDLYAHSVIKFKDGYPCLSRCEIWNGDEMLRDENWEDNFYTRFLSNLLPTDYLTIMDYHY